MCSIIIIQVFALYEMAREAVKVTLMHCFLTSLISKDFPYKVSHIQTVNMENIAMFMTTSVVRETTYLLFWFTFNDIFYSNVCASLMRFPLSVSQKSLYWTEVTLHYVPFAFYWLSKVTWLHDPHFQKLKLKNSWKSTDRTWFNWV